VLNITAVYTDATARFKPTGRFQVLGWEAFNTRHVFSPYRIKGRVNIEGVTRAETNEVIAFGTSLLPDPDLKFSHGTFRVHPLIGIEYLVDFVKPASGSETAKHHRVGVLRGFSPELSEATRYVTGHHCTAAAVAIDSLMACAMVLVVELFLSGIVRAPKIISDLVLPHQRGQRLIQSHRRSGTLCEQEAKARRKRCTWSCRWPDGWKSSRCSSRCW
jgi:hypothetical protein